MSLTRIGDAQQNSTNLTSLDVFSVKTYGAVGNGSTDDTTSIQAAFNAANTAGGGIVFFPPGFNFLISAPLVVYSNTTVSAMGATITLAANSNCNMLIDAAHNANVQTVPSTIFNVTVIGGTWDRGNNNGTNNGTHSIVLGGNTPIVEKCIFKSTAGKYSLLFQNAINFVARDLYMNNTFSDGVHIQGPSARGYIENIRGTTGDDMVAITPNDYSAYTWGNEGDVTDILIDGVQIINQAIANAVRILGGKKGSTVLNTKRIKVKNITGTGITSFGNAVYIGDDNSDANTRNGQIDDVTIDGISVILQGASNSLVNISGISTSLTIPNITIKNVAILSDMSSVVSCTHLVTNLVLENVKGTTSTTTCNGIVYLSAGSYTTITRLMMSHIDITYAGSAGGNLINAATSGQVLADVWLSDVYINNMAGIADIITTTNFYLSDIRIVGNSRILFLEVGAAVIVQGASGINAANTSNHIVSGTAIESKSLNFPLDCTNAFLTLNNGDMAYNTNSGLAAGVGPVIYNGSAWQGANSSTFVDLINDQTIAGNKVWSNQFNVTNNAPKYLWYESDGATDKKRWDVLVDVGRMNWRIGDDADNNATVWLYVDRSTYVSATVNIIQQLFVDNINITLGHKLSIGTGTNASAGSGTLSGGTVTIATNAVTSSSLIFLTDTSNGANLGTLSVGTKTAGTQFVVNSSNALDASTFNWLIIN